MIESSGLTDVDLDDLIHSFEGLRSGRYDDEGIGGIVEGTGATTDGAVSGNTTDIPYEDASGT